MTPDMKRLCDAAATVSLAGDGPNDTNAQIYERIARAILLELQKTSEGMRREGGYLVQQHFPPSDRPQHADGIARDVIVGVIGHILAKPAKA